MGVAFKLCYRCPRSHCLVRAVVDYAVNWSLVEHPPQISGPQDEEGAECSQQEGGRGHLEARGTVGLFLAKIENYSLRRGQNLFQLKKLNLLKKA